MKNFGYYIAIGLGTLLAALTMRLPDVVPINAPNHIFSAARAFVDIKEIAKAPHEIGSLEHDKVRDYLRSRLENMGMATTIQAEIGYTEQRTTSTSAPIENIIGVVKGKDASLPALMLMSHYDTQTHSPGAADDSTGVAASIEIARAILARGTPERDVIILLSDGEEFGLLGAQAFFDNSPLSPHVGVVLNMETRGDDGLAAMFETGPNNYGMMKLYAASAKHPAANSLASAVYRKMPNGSDFTHAVRHGKLGLNFAFTADELAYHTPLSTPEHLNLKSVQHMGDQVMPLALGLAFSKVLPEQNQDGIFSDILGLGMAHYPLTWNWWISALMLGMLGVAILKMHKTGQLNVISCLRFFAGTLAAVLVAATFLRLGSSIFHGQSHEAKLVHFPFLMFSAFLMTLASIGFLGKWASNKNFALGLIIVTIIATIATLHSIFLLSDWGIAAVICVATIAFIWLGTQKAKFEPINAWLGALAFNCVLGVALSIFLPEGTPIVVWPCLLGLALMLYVLFIRKGQTDGNLVQGLLVASAVLIFAQVLTLGSQLFTALGAETMMVVAPLVAIAIAPLTPLLLRVSTVKYAGAFNVMLLVCAFAALTYARLVPSTEARPLPIQITRTQDNRENVAAIHTRGGALDNYTRNALLKNYGTPRFQEFVLGDWGVKTNSVTATPILIETNIANDILTIHAKPRPNDVSLEIQISFGGNATQKARDIRLDSKPILAELTAQRNSKSIVATIRRLLPSANGMTVTLPVTEHGKVWITVKARQNHWPQGAQTLPPKPANVMPIYSDGFNKDIFEKVVEW